MRATLLFSMLRSIALLVESIGERHSSRATITAKKRDRDQLFIQWNVGLYIKYNLIVEYVERKKVFIYISTESIISKCIICSIAMVEKKNGALTRAHCSTILQREKNIWYTHICHIKSTIKMHTEFYLCLWVPYMHVNGMKIKFKLSKWDHIVDICAFGWNINQKKWWIQRCIWIYIIGFRRCNWIFEGVK